jgi:hypothetical protein
MTSAFDADELMRRIEAFGVAVAMVRREDDGWRIVETDVRELKHAVFMSFVGGVMYIALAPESLAVGVRDVAPDVDKLLDKVPDTYVTPAYRMYENIKSSSSGGRRVLAAIRRKRRNVLPFRYS